jgi:hypothetical protein
MILVLSFLWATLIFTLTRQCFFLVTFWALTFQILSLFVLGRASGRARVEHQMLIKLNDRLREKSKSQNKVFYELKVLPEDQI